MMEEIINELKKLRIERGLSISEVARRMGTGQPNISNIESGKCGLTLKAMLKYADALGLKVTIKFEKI